jgi:hypothetical protein
MKASVPKDRLVQHAENSRVAGLLDEHRLKQELTEEGRNATADHVIAQLKERGDFRHLSEGVKPTTAPST